MSVYFDNRQEKIQITDSLLKNLENVVEMSLYKEGIKVSVEVSISFVENDEIQELNKSYRNTNKPTDVLSFPLVERSFLDREQLDKGEILLGDIIISIPKAVDQAEEYGHSFLRELAYLIVHGMYHLLGYDHITLEEKKIMREKEEMIMESLQITRTLS